jgi:hypothetical protein
MSTAEKPQEPSDAASQLLHVLAVDSGAVVGFVQDCEGLLVSNLLVQLAHVGSIETGVSHSVTVMPDGEKPTVLKGDANTFGLDVGENGYLAVRQEPSPKANLIPVDQRHEWYRSARRNIQGLETKVTLVDLMLQPFSYKLSVRIVSKLLLAVAAVARNVPAFKRHVSIGDIEERCGDELNTDVERWLYILYRTSEFFALPEAMGLLEEIDAACAKAAQIFVFGSDGARERVL